MITLDNDEERSDVSCTNNIPNILIKNCNYKIKAKNSNSNTHTFYDLKNNLV